MGLRLYLIKQLKFFRFLPVLYFCVNFFVLLCLQRFLQLLHLKMLSSSLPNFTTSFFFRFLPVFYFNVSFHVLLCLQSFFHLLHLKILSSSLSNIKVRIEGSIENKSCATIFLDPKTFFEFKPTTKIA